MSLLLLWKSNPEGLAQYRLRQIVAMAGTGELSDRGTSAQEFREFIAQQELIRLQEFVREALEDGFSNSGFALQDIVNEFGRRLEYDVEFGRYRGTRGPGGFDGLWRSPDGWSLIVEVKTTDSYRINLDTLANYRRELVQAGRIDPERSSILIVVGRDDTGDLEAQVRGSRHAWDTRIISAKSLGQLVTLRTKADDHATARRIRNLLEPVEYTRLDGLIETLFITAEDVSGSSDAQAEEDSSDTQEEGGVVESRTQRRTAQRDIDALRNIILQTLHLDVVGENLIKRSKATYWSADRGVRVCCTISKYYERTDQYWYAVHPQWVEFLDEAPNESYVVYGCVDKNFFFAVPHSVQREILDRLNSTERPDGRMYWHIHLAEFSEGDWRIKIPGDENGLPVNEYRHFLKDHR
ncbi:MAG: hypothetical protein RIB45_02530 [Marivibrio sp.]|uniref:hypothetical protein n=1 Tax=Marivibrio sp. TaxID=2039719 RepID=UPI0032ED5DB8